eukprot:350264-Chlamydomonas_euryale.AAC.8
MCGCAARGKRGNVATPVAQPPPAQWIRRVISLITPPETTTSSRKKEERKGKRNRNGPQGSDRATGAG